MVQVVPVTEAPAKWERSCHWVVQRLGRTDGRNLFAGAGSDQAVHKNGPRSTTGAENDEHSDATLEVWAAIQQVSIRAQFTLKTLLTGKGGFGPWSSP